MDPTNPIWCTAAPTCFLDKSARDLYPSIDPKPPKNGKGLGNGLLSGLLAEDD